MLKNDFVYLADGVKVMNNTKIIKIEREDLNIEYRKIIKFDLI